MGATFRANAWEIDFSPPWTAKDVGHCIEITQPRGAGGLHISTARKQAEDVADSDLRRMALEALPEDTPIESISLGDFRGLVGEYVDWGSSAYWKKWWLFSGPVLLHATYTCSRGDEEIDADDVEQILSSLATR